MRLPSKFWGSYVRKKNSKKDGHVSLYIWLTDGGGRFHGWFRAVLTSQCQMGEFAHGGAWEGGQSASASRAWSEESSIICENIDVTATRLREGNGLCSRVQNGQRKIFVLEKELLASANLGKPLFLRKTFVFGADMNKNLCDLEGELKVLPGK